MKIAMLLDAAGRAARPEANGTVYVYERKGSDWIVSRKRSHAAADCTTVAQMRAYLTETCQWLGDCTVLAAETPRGFGRLVFAQKGIDFWAIDGEPRNYLDQIEAAYPQRLVAASKTRHALAR
jgi:hypothetical protein